MGTGDEIMGNYWLDKANEEAVEMWHKAIQEELKKISKLDCVVGMPEMDGIVELPSVQKIDPNFDIGIQ